MGKIEKGFLLGLGLLGLGKKKVAALIKILEKEGKGQVKKIEEIEKITQEIVKEGQKQLNQLQDLVKKEIRKNLKKELRNLGFVTKEDLKKRKKK